MLRRIAIALLLLLGTVTGARAQSSGGNVGNNQLVRFTGVPSGGCLPNQTAINNSNSDYYDCSSPGLMWVKVGSGGSGGAPGSPTNSIQFNSAGSLGGVANLLNGTALNCDGMMTACTLKFTNGGSNPPYMIYGSDGTGFIDFYEDGGLFLDGSSLGTNAGGLGLSEGDSGTYLQAGNGSGTTGVKMETSQRLMGIGRFQFAAPAYVTLATGTNFTPGAGWGSTASVTASGGSDNLFVFDVVAGGTGIAINPTFTYTYADGDFSTGNSTVHYVCTESGGNDIIADITTTTRNQTNEVFTWHGLPTTGKEYEITCFGAATN